MQTRRQIIRAATALGALAASGTSALAASGSPALRFHKVVFDGRSSTGLQFAAQVQRLGGDIHDGAGDITALYADHLLARWRVAPAAVAGLTSPHQLFALRLMAEGAGLRLVYAGHHPADLSAAAPHVLFGPQSILSQAPALAQAGPDWSAAVARLVMGYSAAEATVSASRSNIAAADDAAPAAGALVSWVLAPVRRV